MTLEFRRSCVMILIHTSKFQQCSRMCGGARIGVRRTRAATRHGPKMSKMVHSSNIVFKHDKLKRTEKKSEWLKMHYSKSNFSKFSLQTGFVQVLAVLISKSTLSHK